jgi:hypothetical protein
LLKSNLQKHARGVANLHEDLHQPQLAACRVDAQHHSFSEEFKLKLRHWLLIGLLCSANAWAGGLESLETFVKTVKSGRADFTQTVTAPAREGQPGRVKTSTGTFEFQRPGKFKFDYQKPFAQTIVADGKTLWLYDADLNQVTQRAQAQALGSTPAALIAAAPDLRALQPISRWKPRPSAMACSGSRPRRRTRMANCKACRSVFRAMPWRRLKFSTASASARC